ncbi:30S ribosome-binding factor RbfA [Pleionea sp. CnH1-48]|uniref:30S ribosome-binding factor RbfA n=1 Tax=Pleionea sp. CnH1-48 TaxID=2954494 RepID=UPI0020984B75|nr:30S ribosome-binding factor RbfA [Pleionea sp. CnH1-48]MCO7225040.1 30S ribosome-binding factor RbfA [Pleionea sp. CnH1-48]
MAREFKRTDRVSEQLQRELAIILQREMKDPRVGMPTVSAVDITKDLQHAKVYVSFLGIDKEDDVKTALEILTQAEGFIRSTLAQKVRMRVMPHLHFQYDASIIRGQEMTSLINEARSKDTD